MQYFTAEAKEARKDNKRLFDSRKERVNSALFREFSKSHQGGEGGESPQPGCTARLSRRGRWAPPAELPSPRHPTGFASGPVGALTPEMFNSGSSFLL